jgi:uncharacterized LabA/DUF88 family protein
VRIWIGVDSVMPVPRGLEDRIAPVSGDSNYVPSAKLALRKGATFILNSPRPEINEDFHESADHPKQGCQGLPSLAS